MECGPHAAFGLEDSPASVLSDEERGRARGMASERAKRSFVAGRSVLRRVLGRHLGCEAADVPLRLDERGKPCLTTGGHPPFFSLSHAWPYVAVTVCGDGETGIDVELRDRACDLDLLCPRVLRPAEQAEVRAADDPRAAFLTYWTVKEAVAKATGLGLALDFTAIGLDASPLGGSSRRLTASADGLGAWCVTSFPLGRSGLAAVATRQPHSAVRLHWLAAPAPSAMQDWAA